MEWVGPDKEEASRGREALALILKSVSESENKENIMSDMNFDEWIGEGMRLDPLPSPQKNINTNVLYNAIQALQAVKNETRYFSRPLTSSDTYSAVIYGS